MSHPAFTCLRQTPITSLGITVEEYRHLATNARHLHLVAEDNNNAFLVAFLTAPQDSTGVAHILEHTALCGSVRYPVRDPFFMMTRRSLNTFMNAITASDWTSYPFASQNCKDFDNLLKVYLDAAFFPRLDPLDFAQEGHRVEFTAPDNPNTPLVYKGVVFNEMKGAMSSPINLLLQTVQSYLFPTVTYHYNSGGDPQVIPRLTHAQLKAFHTEHYHPSNAIFMTYGDRPAVEHQQHFEEYALKHFQALDLNIRIPDEQRYATPQQMISYYPVEENEDLTDKTHIVLAWLLGHTTDSREMMNLTLLSGILLDNSASPLRYALETSELGTAPSPLCGLEESYHEASFACGLEGSNPEQAEAVESLILQVLTEVATKGVPLSQVESVLHQLELSQREISGDGTPYGLRLLLSSLSSMIHGGDPVDALDIDPLLAALREDIQHPDFIPSLVRRLLLDNPHRVRLVMAPDPQLKAKQLAEESAQLATLQSQLTTEDKAKLIEQATALQLRQQTKDDPELLPKVGLSDIADDLKLPESTQQTIVTLPVTWFAKKTNGMVYQSIVSELPALPADLVDLLPLFCDCLTEVGCGHRNYLQTAEWQAAISGGLYARISWRGHLTDVQKIRAFFSLSGKALVRNQAALTELLRETLIHARFDELTRLRELIAQLRVSQEGSITQRGHHLALAACVSGLSPSGLLSHRWHGLASIRLLKQLDDSLENNDTLAQFAAQLTSIRDHLLASDYQMVVVSEAEQQDALQTAIAQYWSTPATVDHTKLHLFQPTVLNGSVIKQAWSINTQVNFCAKAYPTVAMGHPDAPALTVLGDFLRNGYLHTAIRERGGAYGSGAGFDGDSGTFRFFSYRDPRLVETLADFDQAMIWLKTTTHEPRALEEAILGLIGRIDRPGSPAGEAKSTFFNTLHGRTPQQRRAFRKSLLQVTLDDLQRVATTYLKPSQAHFVVLTDGKTVGNLPSDLQLEHCVL